MEESGADQGRIVILAMKTHERLPRGSLTRSPMHLSGLCCHYFKHHRYEISVSTTLASRPGPCLVHGRLASYSATMFDLVGELGLLFWVAFSFDSPLLHMHEPIRAIGVQPTQANELL